MSAAKPLKIMLIEDDDELRALLAVGINAAFANKIKIDQHDNAEFALSNSFKKLYDLVIIDFKLTGMSGLDFIQAIRNFPERQMIPFIFISGYFSELKSKVKTENLENLYFLEKPFTVEELVKQMKMILA